MRTRHVAAKTPPGSLACKEGIEDCSTTFEILRGHRRFDGLYTRWCSKSTVRSSRSPRPLRTVPISATLESPGSRFTRPRRPGTRSQSFSNGSASGGSREGGLWKFVFRLFMENEASRKLLRSLGLLEAGTYDKHARLDGVWKDVVTVERLTSPTALDR